MPGFDGRGPGGNGPRTGGGLGYCRPVKINNSQIDAPEQNQTLDIYPVYGVGRGGLPSGGGRGRCFGGNRGRGWLRGFKNSR